MKKITITTILVSLLLSCYPANAATNSKNNKNSCNFIKTKYKSEVMTGWANGVKSDSDVLKEINENIKMLFTKNKTITGTINTTVKSWIVAEQKTKKAIENKSIEEITKAMDLKIISITKFDKLCKSISK